MKGSSLWLCAALLVLTVPARAWTQCSAKQSDSVSSASQARIPDRLILTGRFDHLVSSGSGGVAGASWLHMTRTGALLNLGAFTNRLAGSDWHYGTVGAFHRRGRSSVSGSVDLGGGRENGSPFSYLLTRAGAGYSVVPGALNVSVGAEYLDVNRTKGWVTKGSATWQASRTLGLTTDYRHSLSNALDVQQILVRADVRRGSTRAFGGVATGRFLASETIILELDVKQQTEWFGGVAIAAGPRELTLVWSTLSSASTTRHSLGVSLGVELGGVH